MSEAEEPATCHICGAVSGRGFSVHIDGQDYVLDYCDRCLTRVQTVLRQEEECLLGVLHKELAETTT